MRKFFATVLFLLTFFGALPSYAFQFEPITVDFTPTGENATRSFLVSNEGKKSIAIQITVMTRDVDLDGNENREEVEDFIVYPSQLILLPDDEETIRVSWAGSPTPSKELAYRIIGEQLPIFVEEDAPTDKSTGKFNIAMRYVGAIYVVPDGVEADVVIDSASLLQEDGGAEALEIVFHNKGTAHKLLKGITLEVSSKGLDGKGESIQLTAEDIPDMPLTDLLAGFKRRFVVDWPENIAKGDVEVTLISE
ncbi:MAG: fimbrial chaperone protein [Chlamydiales bacterium]|jgi:fimbrial chaperone protein